MALQSALAESKSTRTSKILLDVASKAFGARFSSSFATQLTATASRNTHFAKRTYNPRKPHT